MEDICREGRKKKERKRESGTKNPIYRVPRRWDDLYVDFTIYVNS
jgi:hypothetical protein